jgi:predicted type IV restriction endonuclease
MRVDSWKHSLVEEHSLMPMTKSDPPEESMDIITELSQLNVVQDVCHGQRKGVEENIKTGVTNDMLEALGWDRRSQMDFEHNVGPKSADISLIKNGDSKVIIETKSLEKKIEDHKSQGLEYARKKGIVWTVMTNGLKTQLYKSNIEGVPDSQNEPVFESTLRELPEKFIRLYHLI